MLTAKALILPLLMPMVSTHDDIQIECLREAVYFEARGEGITGQALVGDVIANRVESWRWPDNYCDVIHQSVQFEYLDLNEDLSQIEEEASIRSRQVAEAIYFGNKNFRGISKGSVLFHGKHMRPKDWDFSLLRNTINYKNHMLYAYK